MIIKLLEMHYMFILMNEEIIQMLLKDLENLLLLMMKMKVIMWKNLYLMMVFITRIRI